MRISQSHKRITNRFQFEGNLITLTVSTTGAGLVTGALEDDDDNDDTATRNFDWVLSFRDKPKLNGLVFKSAATTSAPLRALTGGARAKTGVGEDAAATFTEFKTELNKFPFTESRGFLRNSCK